MDRRISFEEAISDPLLFKARFAGLSLPQQVALKAMNGSPLAGRELDIWSAFQGGAEYDSLGYPISITPVAYSPKSYNEAWVVVGRRGSKALPLFTPIPTPSGWTTMGALQLGDTVFGKDGKPTLITAVSGIFPNNPCYRVHFSDHTSLVADADHLWEVRDKSARKHKTGKLRILTTQQMLDEGLTCSAKDESRFAIDLCGAVEFEEQDLPMDPYLLGVWLGDGTTQRAEITTTDPEILEAVRAKYPQSYVDKKGITYGFLGGLRMDLQNAGVFGNKHIPEIYLRASVEQRLALLQGLLDTDGWVSSAKGSVGFVNTKQSLAAGVKSLAESLGFKATMTIHPAKLYGRFICDVWKVGFCATRPVFRLARKLAKQRTEFMWRQRYIRSIEPVDSQPTKCIAVDSPDHCYLAGENFIVTHNTDAIAATQVAYEALCGGHEDFIRKGQRAICFQIAQDLRMARYSLHFISAALESSPIGKAAISQVTADRIDLNNGITISVVPPTLKSVRGYACPVAVLDEVGVWYQESDSANPDYEIYRALSPGQLQFPNRKIIGISTPWNKSGMLYKFYNAGTEGRNIHPDLPRDEYRGILVLHGSTALMENPLVTRDFLQTEARRDPRAFERECLAVFQDSISGFLPSALIEKAIMKGVMELEPQALPTYVAAIDPAFKRDAFGLTICHRDNKGNLVVDAVRRWLGTQEKPLNPRMVLAEIGLLLRQYRLDVTYSDQYHLESLSQLAQEFGLTIVGVPFTAKAKAELYGNLQQLFFQGRIRLLDHEEMLKELRVLERELTEGGNVQISAPSGFHDDLASTLCLAAQFAISLSPREEEQPEKVLSTQELCRLQVTQRSAEGNRWD